MTTAVLSLDQEIQARPLKPFGLVKSIFLFGIPGMLLAVCLLWLWPTLIAAGYPRNLSYVFSSSLLNGGLIVASLVGYRLEGNPLKWGAFARRMRLTAMSGRVWLWAVLGALLFGILSLLVNSLAIQVYKALNFTMPDISAGSLSAWMTSVVLFFNIVGEELWWRGYILPRQEIHFGRFTWLLHGSLWACFHMFKWWVVPFMLLTCQVIPFIAQRTRNTWPGIISHIFVNGAGIILAAL